MSNYKSFAMTVTGISHTKQDKGCEDSSSSKDDTGISIAVVADGHGDDNCFRSAMGAKLAVACGVRGMEGFIKYLDELEGKGSFLSRIKKLTKPKQVPGEMLTREDAESCLRKRLIKEGFIPAWFNFVAEDFNKNPFTEEELAKAGEKYRKRYSEGQNFHHAYGATLIAAAVTSQYWLGIHIGDGRFTALYPDGSFDQPVPWDDKCYLNVTTSVCDDDAAERARCYFSFIDKEHPAPAAVFLCSDGIDDNYPVDGNEKHLFNLYRTIAVTFAEDGFDSTCVQLKDLANGFATKGKGDDTSIAGFIDMEALKTAVPVWKKQIAEEEAAI
jgi:serine/threonine protein phosphatase PrpC